MQRQDFFNKQPKKVGFSGGAIRQPQPQSKSNIRIWIILIAIVLLGVLWYFYKNQLFNQDLPEQAIESGYTIGTSIEKEGSLVADGDLVTYTHTLTTNEGEQFLLKSSTISLNNYSSMTSGTFLIQGTIVSLYQDLPLVEVSSVTTISSENMSGDNNIAEEISDWTYIAQAGIGFPAEFFDHYTFINEAWSMGKISIKNLDNEKITTIEYFNCSNQWDTNCKELNRTFKNTASKTSTNLNGDIFYKLPEVQSWYFQNGTQQGYFINNADDEEVEKIKNQMIITSPEWIKSTVNQYGVKTCLGSDASNEKVASHTVSRTTEEVKVTIEGKGNKNFSCEALIDFSKPTKLKFLDIKILEESSQNNTTETSVPNADSTPKKEATTLSEPITPSTKQFPISMEKTMTYNSSRWEYSMTFPSSNISYTSDATDEDFGQAGVRCKYAIKVIDYKNKDNIQTSPKVIIYECSFKNWFQLPWTNYFQKELDGKKFVIWILDPAWFDFAKNIQIQGF